MRRLDVMWPFKGQSRSNVRSDRKRIGPDRVRPQSVAMDHLIMAYSCLASGQSFAT